MTSVRTVRPVSGRHTIDAANSRIGFSAVYAMVSTVRGHFSRFDADIDLDAERPERSRATVVIYAASIDTGQAQRDRHLRSPDFLDVDSYPEIRFVSTAVHHVSDDQYEMTGDLTIRDVTAPVCVGFTLTGVSTDHRGMDLTGFVGSAVIERSRFGMVWNPVLETGGVLVGDEIGLEFDLALTNSPSPAAPTSDPASGWRSPWRHLSRSIRRR